MDNKTCSMISSLDSKQRFSNHMYCQWCQWFKFQENNVWWLILFSPWYLHWQPWFWGNPSQGFSWSISLQLGTSCTTHSATGKLTLTQDFRICAWYFRPKLKFSCILLFSYISGWRVIKVTLFLIHLATLNIFIFWSSQFLLQLCLSRDACMFLTRVFDYQHWCDQFCIYVLLSWKVQIMTLLSFYELFWTVAYLGEGKGGTCPGAPL